MRRIRLEMGSEKKEKYLNKMAERGYVLTDITPFHWPPLCLLIFKFKDVDHTLRRYRIEYRKFDNKEDIQEYIQLFEDTGWTYFRKNYEQGGARDYIFYNDEPSHQEIYSDTQSAHLEKEKQANLRIYHNLMILIGIIVFYFIFPPQTNGAWIFAIFLIIIMLSTCLYFYLQFRKHRL